MEFNLNKQPSSSGTSTPASNVERDAQLLSIGQQCSADLCHLVDFLPFKCQHCGMSYCGEHFLPPSHKCEKYDETKHNRIAPSCPLCNTPVAIPPGQDPNIRMERHFNTECVVMLGDAAKKSSTPRCPKPKCAKLLYKMASFSCEKCHQQFCPSHRYPDQHACKGLALASNAGKTTGTSSGPRLNASSPAGAAAMAAIRRAMNNASASARKPNTPASTTSQPKSQPAPSAASSSLKASSSGDAQKPSSSRTNPFSATDRSSTFPPNDITTSNDTNANYSNHTNNSNAPADNTNSDNNPPQRCSPKQPSGSTSSFLDTMSFVPRPVFATA